MTARLLACPSCARHIRLTEERCPFCGTACLESSDATMPPPRGLSREELYNHARTAARVAGVVGGGVAIAIALSACDHSSQGVIYGGPPSGLSTDMPDASPEGSLPGDAGSGGSKKTGGGW